MVRWGALLALAVVLASPAALAAGGRKKAPARQPRAPQQRVVVLDLEGDARGRLRAQVEAALRQTRQVRVVPLRQYTAAARKAGLLGADASQASSLPKVAPRLALDAAVTGEAGRALTVRVLDVDGRVLAEQDARLVRGKLTPAEARKVARALVAAVNAPRPATPDVTPAEPVKPPEPVTPPAAVAAAPRTEPTAPVTPPSPEQTPRPENGTGAPSQVPEQAQPPAVAERPAAEQAQPPVVAERPAAGSAPVPTDRPVVAEAPRAHVPKPRDVTREPEKAATAPRLTQGPPPMRVDPESHTTTDPLLDLELDTGSGGTVGEDRSRPPMLRLFLAGTTTWRRYCARPGVKSCGEFDRKPEEEQLGDTLDFSSSVPYLGVAAELEVLPLARSKSAVRGLGLLLGYQRGYSSTNVTLRGPAGQTPTREVVATDTAVTAQALYRYYFGFGANGLLGYGGVRAGLHSRAFDVDESAESPLTGTHRVFPALGLDVSVPLLRAVRLEASGGVFLNPRPGRSLGGDDGGALDLEVSDFGESVSSFGWNAELGVAGDIWGPIGYAVRFRLSHFQDTFKGAGARTGWEQGGAAEETYSSLHWGLTASY